MSRVAKIDGLPIVNAKRAQTVTVTKQDIAKANLKEPANCAVARACARVFSAEARVHLSRVYLKTGTSWTRYMTPRAMRDEIIAFDRGGAFEPGVYILERLKPSRLATGKRQGSPDKINPVAQKRYRKHHVLANVRPMAA